jgi:hypothetical protein
MSRKVFPFIIIYLDVEPIPLENHGKTPFKHILMNLTNGASCPIMLRLYVIVVGEIFLFSKFLKMFMEFYVGSMSQSLHHLCSTI